MTLQIFGEGANRAGRIGELADRAGRDFASWPAPIPARTPLAERAACRSCSAVWFSLSTSGPTFGRT